MADPISMMAVVSMGTAAAGAGVKAFGQLQEGEAASSMYAYKAAVAQQNAAYQRQAGEVAAQRVGMKARYEQGQTKVAQGAGGLDVNTGTNVNVRTSEHDVGVQEQQITYSDYARRAFGEEAESQLDIAAGKNAKSASKIAAIGSILGGASSVSDKWMAGKTAGMTMFG